MICFQEAVVKSPLRACCRENLSQKAKKSIFFYIFFKSGLHFSENVIYLTQRKTCVLIV